ASMTISELKEWVEELPKMLTDSQLAIALPILKELHRKLCNYIKVGLSYLTLDRSIPTLSGGELQRLRLIKQLSSGITNMLYVLDEPSTGLHAKDYEKLIELIKELRDYGNTVLVVEHNVEIMRIADYIIDVGPGAGCYGGKIVAAGTPLEIMKNYNSETGKYLLGKKKVTIKKSVLYDNHDWIELIGARCNNLKNIRISFPVGAITCITGVSGSGKSSLVSQCLYPAIQSRIDGKKDISKHCDSLSGDDYFDRIVYVNQNPIGRTPRSNPATYTGIMDEIRNIFANTETSKQKKYKANKFSFNSKEGQCEKCQGEGKICTHVSFMADIWTKCPICNGKRYKKDVLQIKYKEKSIYDVLEMNVVEASEFFIKEAKITHILNILSEVGLGYLKLGQNATTLSGGEAQRIKLAKELSGNLTEKTLYILDEPTTGLHFSDTQNLLMLLEKIKNKGNSVLIIEHNFDVIKNSDWIIDLGPEGGDKGGYVVAQGTPEQVAKVEKSYTGRFLKRESKTNDNVLYY
ncbi:excinuclease ABC subunit UvrA, partial [Clostridiaceae bacterium UIB06]|nr:excinuclease ABC subunit UvrA [Clostridiaceae bacterium UIB06]